MARVNWVICPKCNFRYYIGPQLLEVEGMHTLCPKCNSEFNPGKNIEKSNMEVKVADKLF